MYLLKYYINGLSLQLRPPQVGVHTNACHARVSAGQLAQLHEISAEGSGALAVVRQIRRVDLRRLDSQPDLLARGLAGLECAVGGQFAHTGRRVAVGHEGGRVEFLEHPDIHGLARRRAHHLVGPEGQVSGDGQPVRLAKVDNLADDVLPAVDVVGPVVVKGLSKAPGLLH